MPPAGAPGAHGIMVLALFAPAPHLSDRRRGRARPHDHDPAAAVLRGKARRQPLSGRVADRHLCGLPADLRAAAGPHVGLHGAQAAADRQPDRHLCRIHRHRFRAESRDSVPGPGHRRLHGRQPLAGSSLHRRRHQTRRPRQILRHHRHLLRPRLFHRTGHLRLPGALRLSRSDLRGGSAFLHQHHGYNVSAASHQAGQSEA